MFATITQATPSVELLLFVFLPCLR